ncbi:potential GPI-protein transamidase complex subunit [Pseudozyma hubeiensis SY62]|uniref:Potential GPI-protein transamidase complex subunit n=1 Tax=Pseudozyma hubeiensis (strain SY62) TaxID=1305764 RepID=R9P5T7_PSEHS|nr:potential GPI-protein transamidase complex subunit [Pseudozyma hubeiensis SY62]GAC93460.1 potential GPI-protein transamidase complex subunit [Pseudozyma hubeiensis SY62]
MIASGSTPNTHTRRSKRRRHTRWPTFLTLASLIAVSLTTPAHAAPSTTDSNIAGTPSESLHETLLLKPLRDGRVLSSFEFTLSSTSSSTSNFRLLPRALLQPVQHFGVSEVHLSLNSGRWKYDSWGSPVTLLKRRGGYAEEVGEMGKVRVGEESVGTGAELWARFDNGQDSAESWKGLTSALAGLFCTSLDALDERQTVQPHHAFSSSTSGGKTLHALLPTEGVCTENLTPFLKLLPCKNSAGLATLLNPLSLFSATFHGLAIHVTRLPSRVYMDNGREEDGGWQVKLTFTSVFSPAVTRDVSIRNWSIGSLFGRTLDTRCPLADSSLVRILKPDETEGGAKYQIGPLPPFPTCTRPGDERHCHTSQKVGKGGRKRYEHFPVLEEQDEVTDELAASGLLAFETEEETREYEQRLKTRWATYLDTVDGEYLHDLSQGPAKRDGPLDVKMSWPHETRFTYPSSNNTGTAEQVIQVDRTLIGSGQERTTLQVTLTNNDGRLAQRVLWYESLGYFVQPYLHTLRHSIEYLPSSTSAGEDELLRGVADYTDPVEELIYQPTRGKRGGRKPFVMEAVVRLPAKSRVVLTVELKKSFVAYSQHPPDAHRGFDLSGGIVFPIAAVDPREELRRHSGKHTTDRKQLQPPIDRTSWQDLLVRFAKTSGLFESNAKPKPITTNKNTPIRFSKTQTRIYTLPRLVELATPDFSFVYTNIIFTSTVMALFFGSSLNTVLRTFTDFVL